MERKLIELEDGWAFMKARCLGLRAVGSRLRVCLHDVSVRPGPRVALPAA